MNLHGNIVKRRAISRVMIFALLFQAMLTAIHIPANALGKNGTLGLFSKTFTICTANGIKTVTVKDDGTLIEGESTHKVKKACDVCLFFSDVPAFGYHASKAYSFNPPGKQHFSLSFAQQTGFLGLVHRGRSPPLYGAAS